MSEYKTKDVQALFNVSSETVRKWSEAFREFLSPNATPGHGRHRIFTLDDLRVFALVSEFKSMGKTYDDASIALANGQRAEVPEDIESGMDFLETSLQLDAASEQVKVLTERVQNLHDENIRLRALLEKAEEEVKRAREEATQTRQEARQGRDEVHSRIEKLQREIGRLEAMLEMERDKDE